MSSASVPSPAPVPESGGQRFAALRSHNFRVIWLGLIVGNAGGQMQVAGLGWLVRDLYEEPIYLGLVSLSFALPMILVTPIGGGVADRIPRVTLVKWCQVGFVIQGVLLAALTLSGLIELWHILVLKFAYGVLLALDNPGRAALLPDLVPKEHLTSAVSLNSVAWTGSALFGPAVAGLLLGSIGPGGLFLISGIAVIAILWALFRLRDLPPENPKRDGSLARSLIDGWSYVVRDRPIAGLLALITTTNVLGRSYQHLMPIFARDVLHVGPEAYGLLLSAPGAGALVGGFGLAAARRVNQKLVAVVGWFGFATALVAFTLSRDLILSLVLVFIATVCTTVFNASVATMLQLRSPRELRGRVMSLMGTSNIGGSHLGGMGTATVATFIGAPAAVAAAALVMAVVGVGVTVKKSWPFAESEPGGGGRQKAEGSREPAAKPTP